MKDTGNRLLKVFSVFLAMILFNGCVMYHKTPVTIEQAAKEKIKTRIVLNDNSVEKFKYITYDSSRYYGTRITGNGNITIPIDVNDVSEVRIKSKTGSILLTAIPLAAIVAFSTAAVIGWQ